MTPCPRCRTKEDRMGHEVQGVYDGVLFWECMACGYVWARAWNIPSRDAAAREYADAYRTARGDADA